jgi:Mrp family chromosome partitioning ATPase
VLSGKGGVGKTTVSVNLAQSLSRQGYKVGLLDIDLHGPSVPVMLGLEDSKAGVIGDKLVPVDYNGLKVVSVGFLLNNRNDPVIWRGPAKAGMISQFLDDVIWGNLDYLIVDCPPGTGDEPLTICQLLQEPDGAVIVTTPQNVSAADVKKSVSFCHKIDMPILGVIENMSGFKCPHCDEVVEIFPNQESGKKICTEFGLSLLANIPINPETAKKADNGESIFDLAELSETAKLFDNISGALASRLAN